MKKFFLPFIILLITAQESGAQFTRYIIRLKNKGGTPFTLAAPTAYLGQKAVDRRTRYGITLDSTDLPVTPSYINQIRAVPNVTVLNVSKWMNAISILSSDANAINTIRNFSFVNNVSGLAARNPELGGKLVRNKFQMEEIINPLPESVSRSNADFFNYGSSAYNEIHLHQGEFLHNIGLRGQGMTITVLDAGFFSYNTLRAFDSARINGQILSTWDFVAREASVTEDNSHGMMCLSTIAANIPGQFVGKAPKANFHLFRTEDVGSEYPIEEFNWVCGAERADSLGSEVITSSLGYYDFDNPVFNYPFSSMNGNTTISSIGADLAAKKGMIVFTAVGNEGGSAWRNLIAPSDGDSVVAVGAVSSAGAVAGFSSYGPSSDGQVKPDMASVGSAAVVQNTNNTIATANGTSFATPNMAGLGTVLWQGFPEFNNMRIIRALQQAGSRYTTPDNRMGYGIPNVRQAFGDLLTEFARSTTSLSGCTVSLNWNTKDVGSMKFEIERKAPGEAQFTKVGELAARTGALLANNSYQFTNTVANGSSGLFSYRIRQVLDTSSSNFYAVYIDTTTINITSACVGNNSNPDPDKIIVRVQPNPASGSAAVLVVSSAHAIPNMLIALFDASGKLMMQMQNNKAAGAKNIDLNLSRFARGKYYIRVWDDKKIFGTAEFLKL